jgi:hypothetical protein
MSSPGKVVVNRSTSLNGEVGSRMAASQQRGSASSRESYPFSGPTFVLTHQPPDPPDPEVTYLTGDIGAARTP